MNDLTAADEVEAVLVAGPIARGEENAVLRGARDGHEVRRNLRSVGPVGREEDELGASEREHTRRLWEPEIEADEHADLAKSRVENLELVARLDKLVVAELRQMALPIVARLLARLEKRRAVVEAAIGV